MKFLFLIWLLVVMPVFCSTVAFAQEDALFGTVKEYLETINAEYGIAPEEIYYISQDNDTAHPDKVSALMFFSNGKISVIEDIAQTICPGCSPAEIMQKITPTAIEQAMFTDAVADAGFTNMLTGKVYKPAKDETAAVFLLSYDLGEKGQIFIRERGQLAKYENIKTFIVSVDGINITELVNKQD